MTTLLGKTQWALFAAASLFLIGKNDCHGFSVPPTAFAFQKHPTTRRNMYPKQLEDWDHVNVEDWLQEIGFGRYSPRFAADYGGIGVDGNRLVYLGTEDQLDHIEYQLELIGVDDNPDQVVLGSCIIELVAASEVTPELLESLVTKVPAEHRDPLNANHPTPSKTNGVDEANSQSIVGPGDQAYYDI